jgi:hypothetical protein
MHTRIAQWSRLWHNVEQTLVFFENIAQFFCIIRHLFFRKKICWQMFPALCNIIVSQLMGSELMVYFSDSQPLFQGPFVLPEYSLSVPKIEPINIFTLREAGKSLFRGKGMVPHVNLSTYYKWVECFRVTSLFKTEVSYSIHIIK